jgi:hypothetical protein
LVDFNEAEAQEAADSEIKVKTETKEEIEKSDVGEPDSQ